MKRRFINLVLIALVAVLWGCSPKPTIVVETPIPEPLPKPDSSEVMVFTDISLYAGGHWWTLDPREVEEIVVPGKGSITFYVSGGEPLRFELEPGVKEIAFKVQGHDFYYPVRYTPTPEEKPVMELAPHMFRELGLPAAGWLPVLQEDVIALTVNWPLSTEIIESLITASLNDHLLSLSWSSPSELLIHVKGEAGDTVSLGLSDMTIIPGYEAYPVSPMDTDFFLRFEEASMIERLNIETGEIVTLRSPFFFDYANGWDESEQTASMVRRTRISQGYDESAACIKEFSYSFKEGRIIGDVLISPEDFPLAQQKLYSTAKLEWPVGASSFSHVGASPSGRYSAALFCSPAGNRMLIHNHDTGERVLHKLASSAEGHVSGGSGKVFWDNDETHVVYRPLDDNGLQGVYMLNIVSSEERRIWTKDSTIIAASLSGRVLILDADECYLVNYDGTYRHLPGLKSPFNLVQWLSEDSFLATVSNMSFIYSVTKGETTWTVEGAQAFAMDVSSGFAYLIRR